MKRKVGVTIIITICLIEGLVAIGLYSKYKQFRTDNMLQLLTLKEKLEPVNRFQIKQINLLIEDIKIPLRIDTQTGKTWQLFINDKITTWIPIEE